MKHLLTLAPIGIERWQRLALGIRLAYNPGQPAVIRQYLSLGHRLVQAGRLTPAGAWARMLELLLQTAADEALPWFWRSVCLEHTAQPLARCTHHLGADTTAVQQARVEALHAQLSSPQPQPGLLPAPARACR